MQQWDGVMPPKQKLPAPTKSRTPRRWRLFLLFLAIMTPPSRCLSKSSQHGGLRAPICACIRYSTRCAPIRDSKSSLHRILRSPKPRQVTGNHPVVIGPELYWDGRGASTMPARGRGAQPFFLQCGTNFREEMGNGLRVWITRNEDQKPETKKENYIMKNRKNILTYIVAA